MASLLNIFRKQIKNIYSDIYSWVSISNSRKEIPAISTIFQPFIIIGIPGSLHLVDLCMKFVPDNQKIILVSNGLKDWEKEWALNNLKVDGFLHFERMLEHGRVLDFFFRYFENPFGILDYDCFVMDPAYFSRMSTIHSDTMINALFVRKNEILSLEIPETFMMFFNPAVIKIIQKEYHVNSLMTDFTALSGKVKRKLLTIGIDHKHYPEDYKDYFDTLRLWYSLGLADGYKCNFIERLPTVSKPSDKIYHVGGGSHTTNFTSKWGARGAYLWRRVLETCPHKDLKKEYWNKFGDLKSEGILANDPVITKQLETGFFEQIEKIIACKKYTKPQ